MRKVLVGNLVLLLLILLSNIYFFIDLSNNIELVTQSEGLKSVDSDFFTVTIVGTISHISNNYTVYIVAVGIALNAYFLILNLIKNKK